MTLNRAPAYLWDARRAAERVATFTAGLQYDQYLASEITRAAVERQFEIIGEALVCLRRVAPEVAASIPDLPKIVGFRNMLIHGYAKIDHARVWKAITLQIPELLPLLSRLLSEMDDGTEPLPRG